MRILSQFQIVMLVFCCLLILVGYVMRPLQTFWNIRLFLTFERHSRRPPTVSTPLLHKSINLVDLSKFEPTVDFECPLVRHEERAFNACVYTAEQDVHVSKAMLQGSYWEGSSVSKILRLLRADAGLQFVDIGANIGAYTLAVGHAGVKVLAVEPNPETLRRLRRSLTIGNILEHVTLLHNAVSNEHVDIELGMDVVNRGDTFLVSNISCSGLAGGRRCLQTTVKTITIDDLLPLMTASRAVMKIDVQGSEIRVFDESTASKFFENIDVVAILMEWENYKVRSKYSPESCEKFLSFFYKRNLNVYDTDFKKLGKNFDNWPWDVILLKVNTSVIDDFGN